jgi:hypothetical protein
MARFLGGPVIIFLFLLFIIFLLLFLLLFFLRLLFLLTACCTPSLFLYLQGSDSIRVSGFYHLQMQKP